MTVHRKILIVEDEEQVRRFLVDLLKKAGWQVTAVDSGIEALDILSNTHFDVILCDLSLGCGPTGIDVLQRRPKMNRSTPFLLLTAYGTIDRCREALKSGAADFLEKPTSPAQLLAAADRAAGFFMPATDLDADETKGPELNQAGHLLVRRAIQLINECYFESDLSVGDVAKRLGVSAEHLARTCRENRDQTPLGLIHITRIAAGAHLLANPRLGVYEVAIGCGYKTTKEFGLWFRRLKKVTPSDWRDRLLKAAKSGLHPKDQVSDTDSH